VGTRANAPPPPFPPSSSTRSLEDDLRVAASQLLKARRERLRSLYASEMASWQAELAAKGKTIERR
jgi:hypothetical protein